MCSSPLKKLTKSPAKKEQVVEEPEMKENWLEKDIEESQVTKLIGQIRHQLLLLQNWPPGGAVQCPIFCS